MQGSGLPNVIATGDLRFANIGKVGLPTKETSGLPIVVGNR